MKIKRTWLMAAIAAVGAFMILYTAARQIFGFSLGEAFEDNLFNGVMIAALAIFALNRKLAADEKTERANAAEAQVSPQDGELQEPPRDPDEE